MYALPDVRNIHETVLRLQPEKATATIHAQATHVVPEVHAHPTLTEATHATHPDHSLQEAALPEAQADRSHREAAHAVHPEVEHHVPEEVAAHAPEEEEDDDKWNRQRKIEEVSSKSEATISIETTTTKTPKI